MRSSWNVDWQGKPKFSDKTWPRATLFTTNPTSPDMGSNPGHRVGKQETDRLTYGAATIFFLFYLVCEAIGTAATPGLLCQPRVIVRWLWRSIWNVDWQGKPKFSEKTCPSATFVHHKIPHDQTRVFSTRAAAVGSRWLTAWAMARPLDFGLYPLSGILGSREHDVSETGSVSLLRWGEEDIYTAGSLSKIQFPKRCLQVPRIPDGARSPKFQGFWEYS
jgi:hypothetical protein